MEHAPNDNWERRLRFVAKHYREKGLKADTAWKRFASEHDIRSSLSLRKYLIGAAAVLFGVIGFGTFYLLEQGKPEWVILATAADQQMDVYLPDSSLLLMAGNSYIRYDKKQYGKERRAVEMKGKVFFQVQRDEARPFSVQTSETEILVLGTSFQVTEQDRITSLYVETGIVSFAAKEADGVVLTAGMSADYSEENGEIMVREQKEPNFLSWKTKCLTFHETPLGSVIHDLQDCYQVSITNIDTNSTNLKLTATFNDMPLDEVLFIINQTLDTTLQVKPVRK